MKTLRYLPAFLIAVCVALSLSCASVAHAEKEDHNAILMFDNVVPVSGLDYAQKKMKAFAIAFNNVSNCLIEKMPETGDQWSPDGSDTWTEAKWLPDTMYKCEPQLAEFEKTRIDFASMPENLPWKNNQQKESLIAQGELLDSVHQPIVRTLNFLIRGLGRDSSARIAMFAYDGIFRWYKQKGKTYRTRLQEISELISNYYEYKKKGKMVDGHFECDSNAMRGMERVVKKLADYFDYNVDTTTLRGMKKGVFLFDLDMHSKGFVKNIKTSVAYVRAARDTTADDFKNVQEKAQPLKKIDKNALSYSLASSIPDAMSNLERRVMNMFETTLGGMEALADGSNPVGQFLAQKDIKEYSKFPPSPNGSFVDSIRKSCRHFLNTKDKNGREIKHSTHGGKFFLDF